MRKIIHFLLIVICLTNCGGLYFPINEYINNEKEYKLYYNDAKINNEYLKIIFSKVNLEKKAMYYPSGAFFDRRYSLIVVDGRNEYELRIKKYSFSKIFFVKVVNNLSNYYLYTYEGYDEERQIENIMDQLNNNEK